MVESFAEQQIARASPACCQRTQVVQPPVDFCNESLQALHAGPAIAADTGREPLSDS